MAERSGSAARPYCRDEGINVILGRIEGRHPANDALCLIPDVERPVLLQCRNAIWTERSEHSIRLDRVASVDAGDPGHFGSQPRSHSVGMLSAAQPELALKQRGKLCGSEAHLRAELHLLLTLERGLLHELIPHHDHGLGGHRAVLRAAERQYVHADRKIAQFASEVRRGIRQPGAVHEQIEILSSAELAKPLDLIERITGAHLGCLSDLNYPRLCSV